MNQLTDKEKKLLFLLLLVAVSVVCIRFVLIPSITSYEDLKVQVQQGQDQLADLKLRLAQGEQIQAQIEEFTEKAKVASEPFFPVATQERIQQWVIKEAQKANLSLSALTISPPTPQAVAPYTVAAQGEVTYPIGQFYDEITAAIGTTEESTGTTEGEVSTGEAPPAPTEGSDQVLKTTINMTFTAQQGDFVRFLNTVKQMNRHLVIENAPMDSFKEGAGDVSLTLSMYSIHKTEDDVLNK